MRLACKLTPILAAISLAGCGGGPAHSARPTLRSVQNATGHACSTADQAMPCVLATQPPPVSTHRLGLVAPVLQGVDFAWTKVPAAQAGSFGASYIAPNDPSKGWSGSLVNAYHAAGKGTVAVFEEGGNQAAGGCAQGRADAIAGESYLAQLGFPHSHEDLAIDFDSAGPDVLPYFQCASQAEPGLVGAYGGYRPLLYLFEHHAVDGLNWQTYAWSGGLWLPASIAPLEQWLNGSSFDHDRAIAANYGQFPAPGPVGPSAATVSRWRGARNASFAAYHARGCKLALNGECGILGQRVRYFQGRLWTVGPRFACFGAHARDHAYVCWIVRPVSNYYSHARDASRRAYDRLGCDGPAGFPSPIHSRPCNLFRQRQRYFNAKASRLVKAYR